MLRRVVVTGVGAITSLGARAETTWSNILAGKSGLRKIDHLDVESYSCQIASMVNHDPEHPDYFDPDLGLSSRDRRDIKLAPSVDRAVIAASAPA